MGSKALAGGGRAGFRPSPGWSGSGAGVGFDKQKQSSGNGQHPKAANDSSGSSVSGGSGLGKPYRSKSRPGYSSRSMARQRPHSKPGSVLQTPIRTEEQTASSQCSMQLPDDNGKSSSQVISAPSYSTYRPLDTYTPSELAAFPWCGAAGMSSSISRGRDVNSSDARSPAPGSSAKDAQRRVLESARMVQSEKIKLKRAAQRPSLGYEATRNCYET